MWLNNRGFAITGILYTLFVMFLLILVSVLGALSSRKNMLESSTIKLEESYQGSDKKSNDYVSLVKTSTDSSVAAPVTGRYTFRVITNMEGFDVVNNRTVDGITYSVNANRVVTVTSNKNDGYGFSDIKVNLDGGRRYTFNCDTNGTWGSGTNDTVEVYIGLDKSLANDKLYRMGSNKNYVFTPENDGDYYLRFDVNQSGKTHTFSNISFSVASCISYIRSGTNIKDVNDVFFTTVDCNSFKRDGGIFDLAEVVSFEEE